jgi:ABC-type branched-subunit amino acid transport system substrate-binding protein
MTRRHPAWRLAAASAAVMLALTACGDDEDSGGSDDTGGGDDTGDTGGPTAEGNGELVIGSLLPQTGDLAFLGPPEFAGVDLAVKDINAAGGVLGTPITHVRSDSGDNTPPIASASVDKLFNREADVVVGAASSDVSMSVIDKITQEGVVHFSPANTSPDFDTYDDGGLYFRTAPSDVLQGDVLGNMAVDDGFKNIAIMARQESYGEGLANAVDKTITERGATVAAKVFYTPDTQQFTSEVQQMAAKNPDAVVVVGFEETVKIVPQLIAQGIGPKDVQVYFVDGNTADYSKDFDPGTLEGVKATYPGAELTDQFQQRLLEINPNLEDFTYGPESYDAVVMSSLAAVAAESDAGEAVASELINISREGTKCTDYAECSQLLESGEDIDYEGVSGPCDLNDTGSPSKATIGIFEYQRDNTFQNVDYITGIISD